MEPTEITVPGISKGYVSASAFPFLVGEFPLHHVDVYASCPGGYFLSKSYRTVFPNEIGRLRESILLQFPPTTPEINMTCRLFITASDGSYSQNVHFLKKNSKWIKGSVLTKYGQKDFRHEYFDPEFPKDYKW